MDWIIEALELSAIAYIWWTTRARRKPKTAPGVGECRISIYSYADGHTEVRHGNPNCSGPREPVTLNWDTRYYRFHTF